jgi:WD40 repeat protein
VKIWDVNRCAERTTLPAQEAAAGALAFSPDGRTLVIGYGGRALADEAYLSLWNTASWEELFRLPAGVAGVRAVAFSPNGKVLAAAGGNNVLNEPGTVRFWRAALAVQGRER